MMRVRSAILLDFDNVWHSLQRQDEKAARRFARCPGVWVDAIASGELLPFTKPEATERAILFLRCYANPNLMRHATCRDSFIRAGFSVIDCPPLTSHGKNSADIHLVLDAVDLLEHATRFDEFIVLSADADFTPLLTKLRTHDRRTAVFANQETSSAYRAVASGILQIGDMLEFLAASGGGRETGRSVADTACASRMNEAVGATVKKAAPAPLATAALFAPDAVGGDSRRQVGYCQFNRLLAEQLHGQLRVIGAPINVVYDPERHEAPTAIQLRTAAEPRITEPDQNAVLAKRIIAAVHAFVAASPVAVRSGTAAQAALKAVGGDHRKWAGYGRFSRLLAAQLGPRLRFMADHVFDPERHKAPGPVTMAAPSNPSRQVVELPAGLRDFALRLRRMTDCPTLTVAQFQTLFARLAERIAVAPFDLNATSRDVRDDLVARKRPIGRAAICFVIRGVQHSGRELGASPAPEALADAYRASLAALCDQAGTKLTKEEFLTLGEWLGC